VESRRQHPARTHNVKKTTKTESSVAVLSLPNITELIEDGEITIGMQRPVGCVATAADEDCTYAMLFAARARACFSCSSASTRLSTRRSPWASSPTKSIANPLISRRTYPLSPLWTLPTHTCQHGLLRTVTIYGASPLIKNKQQFNSVGERLRQDVRR
jgi:hypothetical protein